MKKRAPLQDEREKLVSNKIFARGLYLLCALLLIDFVLKTSFGIQWAQWPWNNMVYLALVFVVVCIERLCRNVFYDRIDTMLVRLVTLPLFLLAPSIAAVHFILKPDAVFLDQGMIGQHGGVIIGLASFTLVGICNAVRIFYDLRKSKKAKE